MNTEGTRLEYGRGFARMVISASAKAADGTDLSSFDTFEAVDAGGLPDDKTLLAAIDHVANDVAALLKAPEAEPFVGPAIFSGRAAGVFFHEIFGHRVEGHRQKDESEGQTFTKSVGTKVLPDFLSVVFDPTRAQNRRHRPERLVRLRRRGREGAAGAGGGQGRAEDLPDVALAD